MKKTKVMSTIAMVCFILALVWATINDIIYYINAFKYNYGGALIARVFFFSSMPIFAGIILLIISMKKAKTGSNPPQYKLGLFFIAGAHLLNFIISLILSEGDMKDSMDYLIRVIILIAALLLVAFDATLLKNNKAMGIVGAALIIGVAVIFSTYYIIKITNEIPRSFYSGDEIFDFFSNIMSIFSYYSFLEFLGIGALLYAIGRQPKDTQKPFTPNYPDGGINNGFDNQYNYIPPQPTDQNNYQPPYNQN